jgi:hypothetical protein
MNNEKSALLKTHIAELKSGNTFLGPLAGIVMVFSQFVFSIPIKLLELLFKKWLKEYGIIELYVCICLIIESLTLFFIDENIGWFKWAILIAASYRILDIGQTWVNVHLTASGKSTLPYPVRTLLLTLINYVELIIIFTTLGYVFRTNIIFDPIIESKQASGISTIGTMTSIGSEYSPSSPLGWVLFIPELIMTLLFLLIVINRAVGILPWHGKITKDTKD